MKNASSDIDFAKAQGEFAAMAAQIAALRKFRKASAADPSWAPRTSSGAATVEARLEQLRRSS